MSMTRAEIIKAYEGAVFDSGLAVAAGNEEAERDYELLKAGLDALRGPTREMVEKVWRGCYTCDEYKYFMFNAWKNMKNDSENAPTLTPQNEALTLISMNDEVPPDNERVLVYRPCMVDSDTGPYSVQWGWSAKRDGSYWAHLPDCRPPERQEDA